MEFLNELWRRLLFLFRRRQFESELEEEMQFHLDMKTRAMGPAAARRQFGNVALVGEDSRAAWGWRWLEALGRDLRHGLRLYRRSPGFTAVAVLTLGLGLGVNIAIFMLLYNVVLRPLPYPDAGRLMKVYVTWEGSQGGVRNIAFSYPKFQDLRRLSTSFQSLAAYGRGTFDLADSPAERVRGELVSSSYFGTLGVTSALGRTFLPDDDAAPGARAVAVIADTLWKRRFAADPAILGRDIKVATVTLKIVGVMPPDFTGETGRAEMWVPITMAPLVGKHDNALTGRNMHWHMVVGRLKPGVTRSQAAAEVAATMRHVQDPVMRSNDGMGGVYGSGLMPLAESRLEPNERRAIFALYGAVGFVLLIACGNLANLTRARMVGRQRETAMRLALGAGRGSLVRQFLAENVLLSLGGGAAGVVLAQWSSRLLIYLRPADYASLPSYFRTLDADSLSLTLPVLAFSAALSLASGLLFGLMPALSASRGNVNPVLKEGITEGGRRGPGFRGVLLTAQVALAVVLLAGGVLMMRSFARLVNDPIGADVHRVLAFELTLPDYEFHNRASRRAFLDRVVERLRALPSAEAVTLADDVPALERDTVTDINVANRTAPDYVGKHDVDAGFFPLFRIPLRAGRLFADRDRESKVAILSERAAATLFPGQSAIGRHINFGERVAATLGVHVNPVDDYEVVGVVGEVRYAKQKQQLPLIGDVYVTPASGSAWVAVRTAADPKGLIASVRRGVAQLDPTLPAYSLSTLEDQIHEENWGPRFAAVLLGCFAVLAVALAMVGIYGVFSYAVAARTREFGIRIANGARAADIIGMVAREGASLCGIGLAVGIPAALATTHALESLLYQVGTSDPLTYVATTLVLILTALGACLIPACRAARVDPVIALRCE